jgi:ribosome-binding factor A
LSKRTEIRGAVAKNVIIRHVPLITFVHDDHARCLEALPCFAGVAP